MIKLALMYIWVGAGWIAEFLRAEKEEKFRHFAVVGMLLALLAGIIYQQRKIGTEYYVPQIQVVKTQIYRDQEYIPLEKQSLLCVSGRNNIGVIPVEYDSTATTDPDRENALCVSGLHSGGAYGK